MQLYLMRHGQAGSAPVDRDRPLTEAGWAECIRVLERVRPKLEVPPRTLISSPYVRARQTAQILMRELSFDGELVIAPELTPDRDPGEVARLLDGIAGPVWLVGHQPLMGELLAWLTDTSPQAFATAGVARLDLIAAAQGCGTLQWQLAP